MTHQVIIDELCEAYLKDWLRRYEVTNEIGEGTYVNKRDQIRNQMATSSPPIASDTPTASES